MHGFSGIKIKNTGYKYDNQNTFDHDINFRIS